MKFSEICSLFLQLTIGGIILGIIFGIISTYWIYKIFNDEILVVNITILSCYLVILFLLDLEILIYILYQVYFIAENIDFGIKCSGIISLVSLGLFMAAFGKTKIAAEADHSLKAFWKYVVYCAETVIFLLAGVLVGIKFLSVLIF